MPIPPLTHRVATPRLPLRRRSSCSERDRDARARAADGMTERDRAAIHVQRIAVEMQLAVAGEHLRGECLVQFDQIEVCQLEAALLLHLAERGHGANAHDARIDPRRSHR